MIDIDIFEKLSTHNAIPPYLSGKGTFLVDDSIGVSILTALASKHTTKQFLIITSNLYKAQTIYNLLNTFLPNKDVVLFPCDELIRAEYLASSKEMLSSRLFALDQILNDKPKVVVSNLAGSLRFLPSPELFKKSCFNFKVGDSVDIECLRKSLILSGYSLVNKIDQSLQFAVRGDIIDIFSVNNDFPIRIELFGDEIETIRTFDIATQKSISKIDSAKILPASEFLIEDKDLFDGTQRIRNMLDKDKENLSSTIFDELVANTDNDISELLLRNNDTKYYKYFGFLQTQHYSLFDYASNFIKVIVDQDSVDTSFTMLTKETRDYLYDLNKSGLNISHLEYYQDLKEIEYKHLYKFVYTHQIPKGKGEITFDINPINYSINKTDDIVGTINSYLNNGYSVNITLDKKEHINTVIEVLEKANIPYKKEHEFEISDSPSVTITSSSLPSGFITNENKIVVLTAEELFNEKIKVARFDNRFKKATILHSFEDLSPGDYVVHEYQGIGKFLSLETLTVDKVQKDYLKIEYHGGELLYVPLTQFHVVRKYLGKEGMSPRLSRLHSKDWENTKKRIKEKVNDLAERLFSLYKERSKQVGFQYQKDDEFQEAFEKGFEFELTADQKKALDEIKHDMESPHPMDRLICGDVGFGKTEVAFRAIFKAILSGKQVAMLCPTTLLARQHYERALSRFAGFDVKIAVFSRLIPLSRQKLYMKEIEEGKIHFAIGTHRLLSKDIHFKDLGLLVVDEEQRFGVEQKEKIKELKNNIDVLTLSATPIPRTLQISLLGVRSLSQINTAPVDRMPIQTYVIPYKTEVVKELIERELGRQGQVFYLHNDVISLQECANKLHKLVPNARIGVAHGQMDKNDIEDVMDAFYKGDIDVLACTSIVENGIDIPNANMIIVEAADRYGLAQLYQIKGRVGRSNRIAYAYLMYNEYKVLNENAQKRLKAIKDFTELGSGYIIAQRDLMIRGAGDILGPEQAGFIDSIGLDMYIKLLNEAVKEKIDGVVNQDYEKTIDTSLAINGYISKEYANDSDKIELYQEILAASTIESLAELKLKTRDIFGKLPSEVEALFLKRNVDILLNDLDIYKVHEYQNNIEIFLGDNFVNIKGVGNMIFEALIPYISLVKVSYVNHKFKLVITKTDDYLTIFLKILESLTSIVKHNKTISIE